MDWKYELLYEKISPETFQTPHLTRDQILNALHAEAMAGETYIIGIKDKSVVFVLRGINAVLAELHVFAKTRNPWDIVLAGEMMRDWTWANTGFQKVEMSTSSKRVCKFAERFGFRKEGVRRLSNIEQGRLVDAHEYGICRSDQWVRQ